MNILAALTQREKDPLRMAQFAKQAEWVGTRIFTPMSLTVLAFGFAIVENRGLGYDLAWIRIALAGWGISFLIGLLFLGPESGRLEKLLLERGPNDEQVQARIRRILMVSRVDALILLFVVFDMTAKPWS